MKKFRRMDQQAEEKKDRKSNRSRQKNKRGDSKVESNDSSEIPDRGKTSDIPDLPSGAALVKLSLRPTYNNRSPQLSPAR